MAGNMLADIAIGLEVKCESPNSSQQADLLLTADEPLSGSSKLPLQPERSRGRPRKHPILTQNSTLNIRSGRTKTGCMTCRRRKKKCDETKPFCELIHYPTSIPLDEYTPKHGQVCNVKEMRCSAKATLKKPFGGVAGEKRSLTQQ